MKKKVLFLLIFAAIMSVVMAGTVLAKEVYTVSVAVEQNYFPKVTYSGINQVSGNVVYDKLISMGANEHFTEFDPESERDIITAVFDKPVDIKKIEDRLQRIPGFEIRDSDGNVLMDESYLSHALESGRVFRDDLEKITYYINIEDDGSRFADEVDKHPGIKTALMFVFTDEGEVKFKEILKELAGREEGKNRYYVYINEKFIVSYKATENYDFDTLMYVGKSNNEHSVLSYSITANGEHLMPKSAEVVKTGGPYTINCSDWAFSSVTFMFANGAVNFEDEDDYTKPITREEFCTYAAKIILGQTRGYIDVTEYESEFKDTKSHEVAMLTSFGIINGKGDGIFAPDDFITREEASAILCRIWEHFTSEKLTADTDFVFADDGEISAWAKENVYAAFTGNIMSGVGEEKFNPGGTFTKEQSFITFKRIVLEKAKTEPWYNAA